MEAFVPDPSRFSEGQLVRVDRLDEGMGRFTASLHDRVSPQIRSRHFVIGTAGVETFPIDMRYAYPAELDLMARLAGMRLTARWGGWRASRSPRPWPTHIGVAPPTPPDHPAAASRHAPAADAVPWGMA